MSRKNYVCTFPGVFMGGVAFIRARDEEEAKEIVAGEAQCAGLPGHRVSDITVRKVTRDQVIMYFHNGDY